MIILIVNQWLLNYLLNLWIWFPKTIIIAIFIVFSFCKTKIHLIFLLIFISLFSHLEVVVKIFILNLHMNIVFISNTIRFLVFVFCVNESWSRLWRTFSSKWIENLILDWLIMMRHSSHKWIIITLV